VTFSIVARDPETGDLGVAVASKFLAVGAVVPHCRAGIGAIATQAAANVTYGSGGLDVLSRGLSAQEAVEQLTQADDGRDHRQLGIVDAQGRSATYSGSACIDWAGGRTAENVACQGNILTGAEVVDALIDTFQAGGAAFPELLLRALKAADERGGDRRGRESAALLVVREAAGYGGNNDRWIDLRVDDHPAPVGELARLLELNHLYLDKPAEDELLPVDEKLAAELQRRLERAGYTPQTTSHGGGLAEVVESLGMTRTGAPRDLPANWDAAWSNALTEWMSVENLEERAAASGWIDPRVLKFLREKTS
jgi:uncharacterized Ntn-hydrolase superfamily protein